MARRLTIAADDAQSEITLRTWRGLYIRGRIAVPDGRLFPPDAKPDTTPNVILIAHGVELGGGVTGQPIADGTFALGPVTDGEYVIETFAHHYAPIEPIRVRAGDGPITIAMQLGALLAGRVGDAQSACEVVLTRLDHAAPEVLGSTDASGAFVFSGVAPGDYVVSAFVVDGRSGASARRRVAAGESVSDVEVPLESIANCGHVRIVLEGAIVPGRVSLWQGAVCRALVFVGGATAKNLAVPAGEIDARLMIGVTCVDRRSVTVTRGATEEVRFRR